MESKSSRNRRGRPGAAKLTNTNRRQLTARQRRTAVLRFRRARHSGRTWAQASRLAGASSPTLSRWTRAYDAHGLAGLLPRTANCGRKSELEKLKLPRWVLASVERIALQQRGSIPAAWVRFSKSAQCPVRLAKRIRQGVPPSLTAATKLRTIPVRFGRHLSVRESVAVALATRKGAK